jgi:surface polysaccharide O-acyltransferase-like enzyme
VKTNERNYSYDVLRILACFLVIVNHTNSVIFAEHFPSVSGYLSLTYFFVCKIAVPLFLMITGALLFTKKETYKILFQKRIFRILAALFVFSFIAYILPFLTVSKLSSIHLTVFLKSIIKAPITFAYWYLYMLIGLLLCMPFLRKMLQNFDTKDYIYYFVFWFIFIGVIPTLASLLKLPVDTKYFTVPVVAAPLGYAVYGHFIGNVADKEKIYQKKYVIAAWIIFIACVSISVLITAREYYDNGKFLLRLDNYATAINMLATACVFYLATNYVPKMKITGFFAKVLTSVSTATFGIYLMHIIIIGKTQFISNWLCSKMNDFLAIILFEFIIFTLGFVITKILQKIPYVKKIL